MNKSQIENLLINLIDNAIKYNKKHGKIYLRAYEKKNKVFIEVEDTGLGISQKNQKRIFERFYRVDKARSKDVGGTGIGLSIVKNEKREGTKFKFYLNKAE